MKGLLAALLFLASRRPRPGLAHRHAVDHPGRRARRRHASTPTSRPPRPRRAAPAAGPRRQPERGAAVRRCRRSRAASCPPASRVGTASAQAAALPLDRHGLQPRAQRRRARPARHRQHGCRPLPAVAQPGGGHAAPRRRAGLDDRRPRHRRHSASGLDLTLDGDFMTLPTSCAPATTTIDARTARVGTFTPTGCASVPFTPRRQRDARDDPALVPSGATVTLTLPGRASRTSAAPRSSLPLGTTLSPGRRRTGSRPAPRRSSPATAARPASQVGTVSFVTPLLGTLGGKVFFGDGFRLYIVVAAARGVQGQARRRRASWTRRPARSRRSSTTSRRSRSRRSR